MEYENQFEKSANRTRRHRKDKFFAFSLILPGIIVLAILVLILIMLVAKGVKAFNPDFFLSVQKPFGVEGGGIVNGILGSLLIMLMASLISIPLSLIFSVTLIEKKDTRIARLLELCLSSFQGVPSIVFGVIMYSWLVVPLKSYSALSAAIAVSFIMIPTVSATIKEVLLLVPSSYKEAAIALGVPRWKAMTGVIVPSAMPGIKGAVALGLARIAGETAPLLFTAFGNPFLSLNPSKPVSAMPLIIYDYIKSPYADWHEKAWGTALLLVLMVFALTLSISARQKDAHPR